jgi:alpha-maltose-1-phosphate synthase
LFNKNLPERKTSMNVTVFTLGRFHHFDLSRQMVRLGHGLALLTSNPQSKVDPDMRPFSKTRPQFRIPYAIGCRLGLGPHLYWLDELLLKDLAKWAERSVDLQWTDVCHAQEGTGPRAGRWAKENGKLWICDRGSTHILAQRKILVEEHNLWQVPPPRFSADRLERCVAEYEQAHAITVPSRFVKRSFIENGIADERVFVCPYGVDLSEFRPGVKLDEKFRVIYVGQITVRKGIGYLLQAVEPLAKKGRVELWLVGEVDSQVQSILDRYRSVFEYKGVCPRKDLWQLYSQASVLVLASVEEGLALVQAQAMACGVPVIATANTGAEDLFTDGVEGFIVPIRDPGAIREKLEWMIENNELRNEMAAAALRRVKSLGGWNQYGECVESVYRELLIRHDVKQH